MGSACTGVSSTQIEAFASTRAAHKYEEEHVTPSEAGGEQRTPYFSRGGNKRRFTYARYHANRIAATITLIPAA
ncbi:MAG: hypothetical protein ACI9TH_004891 [Kiritimatiellia bacterium]|jgi:hypothetical protein